LGDAQTPSRSGLFYVGGGSFEFSALFDQVDGTRRSVMTAAWDGSTLSDIRPAGAPFGAPGADDYSRVYFMSTRDGSPALYTGVLGSSSTTVVTLEVPAESGGGTCARSGEDATPWVTEDGSLLVFRSLPMDAACEPVDGSASDLYVAALQPATGMALTTAVALSGVNVTTGASTETDPSFSPDLCVRFQVVSRRPSLKRRDELRIDVSLSARADDASPPVRRHAACVTRHGKGLRATRTLRGQRRPPRHGVLLESAQTVRRRRRRSRNDRGS
jgi:hypothetical protein